MRTDVKVGLVCAFVLILVVVAYFAFSTNAPKPGATARTAGLTSGVEPGAGLKTGAAATPATEPAHADSAANAQSDGRIGDVNGAPAVADDAGGSRVGDTVGGAVIEPPGGAKGNANEPLGGSVGGMVGGPIGGVMTPHVGLLPAPVPTPPRSSRNDVSTPAAAGSSAILGGATADRTPGAGEPRSTARVERSGAAVPVIPTPGSHAATGQTYTIVRGDTLSGIARKTHRTVKDLEAANPGVVPTRLRVNQKINLPAQRPGTAATPTRRSAAATGSRTTAARTAASGRASARAAANAGSSRNARPGGTYVVKPGDTLRKIAKQAYGDEGMWRRILRTNRGKLRSASALRAGMTLQLPR